MILYLGLKACGGDGFAMSTLSNLNPSCIELELGLGFDNIFGLVRLA